MPYIDDILAEFSDDVFDPDTDLLETFEPDGSQPGGGDTFGLETAEATLVYLVSWAKARSFIRSCLGFCYADPAGTGSPYKLHRENPWVHPRFPWLTAATAHLSSIGPVANPDNIVPLLDPGGAPNFPAVFEFDVPNRTGLYSDCYVTVRFVDRPWSFRDDAAISTYRDEIKRNCFFDPSPSVELISAEGGTGMLQWDQGGGTSQPALLTPIANLFATQFAKCVYTLNWMWVPESYLSSDNFMMFPKNILKCATKVNAKMFANRPGGTLLCQAPQLQRFRFPVCTADGLFPFYGWNVKIPLVYMNPDRGVNPDIDGVDPDPTNDAMPRGHRLMPWRETGYWFSAVRKGLDPVTGAKLYLLAEADLYDIFRHVGSPAP